MNDTIRRLDRDDYLTTLRLGAEAFGHPSAGPAGEPEVPAVWPPAGMHAWGLLRDETLVARMSSRADASWWDGAEVPTSGICGVTVRAEERGQGLLTDLFEQTLTDARDRGEPISTLYPTAPGIYRRFGYEIVATLRQVEIPTAQLAGVRPAESMRMRRATEADLPTIEALHRAWSRTVNGPLSRTTPLFDFSKLLEGITSATLAEDDAGRARGYVLWDRGSGYGADSTLEVDELVALDAEADRALWRTIGSFAAVTGQVRLWTSGDDAARLSLPSLAWREVRANPYMLRILDVAGAFSRRTAPPGLTASLAFEVAGDHLGLIGGAHRLEVSDGELACIPATSAARSYTPQGLALAWSGAQPSSEIRRAGHLSGPVDDDRTWDALLGSAQVHVRDYF